MIRGSRPIFLIGAGFNAAARSQTRTIFRKGVYPADDCTYPLAADLFRLCFGLDSPPEGKSVESLFQAELDVGNRVPLDKLAAALMKADYFLSEGLLPSPGAGPNAYSTFFERFGTSHFLTFNYDALAELFLLRQGRWYPHDGYGVPVEVSLSSLSAHLRDCSSESLVLHLHGSLYIHTSTSTVCQGPNDPIPMLVPRSEPTFFFDPYSVHERFDPFEKPPIPDAHQTPSTRVIAPIPDKTKDLETRFFIRRVYERAIELISSPGATLVATRSRLSPRAVRVRCLDRARILGHRRAGMTRAA